MQVRTEKTQSSLQHLNSTPNSRLLKIERRFSTPVSSLYSAFTTPDSLMAWWWPEGLHSDRIDLNFTEGGSYFINMKDAKTAQGGGMTGRFELIKKDQLIVMEDRFADKNGNAISAREANMPGEWPEICYITFQFEPVGENASRLILFQEGIPNETQDDCIQGWAEMFDKLERYLAIKKQ